MRFVFRFTVDRHARKGLAMTREGDGNSR
jgi:hypothetical protein